MTRQARRAPHMSERPEARLISDFIEKIGYCHIHTRIGRGGTEWGWRFFLHRDGEQPHTEVRQPRRHDIELERRDIFKLAAAKVGPRQ